MQKKKKKKIGSISWSCHQCYKDTFYWEHLLPSHKEIKNCSMQIRTESGH